MKRLAIRTPFDGSLVDEVPVTSLTELHAMAQRAGRGAAEMRGLSRYERASILRKASAAFSAKREDLARTIALEGGKPIREARAEVDRAAMTLLFSSEEASRLAGEEIPMDAAPTGLGRMAMTIREPLGVIAAITPFNFPLNLSMHKVGPAIAAGNAVLHKPASATPLSALRAREILLDCGLPSDALQVVIGSGSEIGDALAALDSVKMITFTGSAAVGLGMRAKAGLKRVTLELGNNSAVVVLRDADLESAVPACVSGAYAHSGQTCISVQRIFVEEAIEAAFTRRFADAAARLRQAHPLSEDADLASLIDEREAERVSQWIAESKGETVLAPRREGAKLSAAVVRNAAPDSKLMHEEAFGPVAVIQPIRDLDHAIASVNDSRFGLQCGIFTNSLKGAWRLAREAHCGGVLVNDVSSFRVDQMPYGGVKESGTGREGPRYAVEEMTELKLVSWRL
jgi:acyl-CoA reductase-like NAD-dependent aldehyde dehydrogenase